MSTQTYASMEFVDVSAKLDSTATTSDNQIIGDVALLENEVGTPQQNYGTFEQNQFVLDGTMDIIPANPEDISFWSTEKSNSVCGFANNPKISFEFSRQHGSIAITLNFVQDYPTEINITWYTIGGSQIAKKTFYPDALTFVCFEQIVNYGKVVVEFVKTRLPGQYVKLNHIKYGMTLVWRDSLIQSAQVHEEIDETGATLAINTANISIIDEKSDYDVHNENGLWKSLQKNQEVTIDEVLDGNIVPAGVFFIDDNSFSNNVASFDLIDRIGLMDKISFRDGRVYENESAKGIVEDIFESAGMPNKFIVDEKIEDINVSGFLPIMTCREALQMVCFAMNAIADDSRSDFVRIYSPTRTMVSTIGPNRKIFGNTKVSLDEYVSGVSIQCAKYTKNVTDEEIYNDTLDKGTNLIEFSDPVQPDSISVSGGTLKEAKTNYCTVEMDNSGTCVIRGKKYSSSDIIISKNVEKIEAGNTQNVKEYSGITLFNAAIMMKKASDLLSYYGLRKKVDMRYFVDTEKVSNWAGIRAVNGSLSATLIESQDIDLTGGFIATASCRGYSKIVTESFYTGTELYAKEDVLL